MKKKLYLIDNTYGERFFVRVTDECYAFFAWMRNMGLINEADDVHMELADDVNIAFDYEEEKRK